VAAILPDRRLPLFVFKVERGYLFAKPEDIAWIEAQDDSIKLCLGDNTHRVLESLKKIEQRLDSGQFLRVHRSFFVNLARIRTMRSATYGDWSLQMDDGTRIPVGRSYRSALRAFLPRRPESPSARKRSPVLSSPRS
jgi:DNA-binding LytR/AlgR family response regulator